MRLHCLNALLEYMTAVLEFNDLRGNEFFKPCICLMDG